MIDPPQARRVLQACLDHVHADPKETADMKVLLVQPGLDRCFLRQRRMMQSSGNPIKHELKTHDLKSEL